MRTGRLRRCLATCALAGALVSPVAFAHADETPAPTIDAACPEGLIDVDEGAAILATSLTNSTDSSQDALYLTAHALGSAETISSCLHLAHPGDALTFTSTISPVDSQRAQSWLRLGYDVRFAVAGVTRLDGGEATVSFDGGRVVASSDAIPRAVAYESVRGEEESDIGVVADGNPDLYGHVAVIDAGGSVAVPIGFSQPGIYRLTLTASQWRSTYGWLDAATPLTLTIVVGDVDMPAQPDPTPTTEPTTPEPDPTSEPVPEPPTDPTPDPSSPSTEPTPAPGGPTEAPTENPSQPVEPSPDPQPSPPRETPAPAPDETLPPTPAPEPTTPEPDESTTPAQPDPKPTAEPTPPTTETQETPTATPSLPDSAEPTPAPTQPAESTSELAPSQDTRSPYPQPSPSAPPTTAVPPEPDELPPPSLILPAPRLPQLPSALTEGQPRQPRTSARELSPAEPMPARTPRSRSPRRPSDTILPLLPLVQPHTPAPRDAAAFLEAQPAQPDTPPTRPASYPQVNSGGYDTQKASASWAQTTSTAVLMTGLAMASVLAGAGLWMLRKP
ncbi:MAG: hypothetical protein Q4B10_06325 [Actinomycetaceae bacterium]|nr:hypothetical protein [Actinomycetaceae bacterium]